jgi:carbon-monoxide dehydrogenase large subunit
MSRADLQLAPSQADPIASADRRSHPVGASVPRVDAHAKVTGMACYSTDYYPAGVLRAKLLFSDRPWARIASIDTSRATSLAGVVAVVTGDDCPKHRYGLYVHDRTILAQGEVRFVGEPVAAVVAVSERIAAEAVQLISVEYEDRPSLLDVEAALADDAPRIHPDLASYGAAYPYIRFGNVCMEANLARGNVEGAFASADVVVTDTYRTPAINHGAIEPHACVGGFDNRGRLTVWTATQQLSVCHTELAMALGAPMSSVRVVPLESGGGFGGKLHTNLEPLVAVLAQRVGRPVRLAMTREEEFLVGKGRAPFTITVSLGATRGGTLVAGDIDIVVDVGGYSDEAVGTATHCLGSAEGVYRIPALRARSRAVYTNNLDAGCMRGYGTFEMMFALERHIDVLASELGMDPADLRMKNLISAGAPMLTGQSIPGVWARETMDEALERSDYRAKKADKRPHRGVGIANLLKSSSIWSSSAVVRLNPDGTVVVTTAAVEIGTGTHTVLTQIAAEILGLPVERVSIAAPDSDHTAYDHGSIGSRTVFDTGSAVRIATEDLRNRIRQRAAEMMGCDAEEIVVDAGRASREGNPDSCLDFAAIGGTVVQPFDGPLVGFGTWNATKPHDPPHTDGFGEDQYPSFGFGTHVAEVEVEPDTGVVRVVNYTACHDVGRAINPMAAVGQIEGGVVQGIGAALWEETVIRDGVVQNPGFLDYRMPTILDAPAIDVTMIEDPDPQGPFGAKGVAEHPILGPSPAIANAIADATGAHPTTIPVTPEALFALLHDDMTNGR